MTRDLKREVFAEPFLQVAGAALPVEIPHTAQGVDRAVALQDQFTNITGTMLVVLLCVVNGFTFVAKT